MLSQLSAAALVGIDALKVEVETNVSGGLPLLPWSAFPTTPFAKAVKES